MPGWVVPIITLVIGNVLVWAFLWGKRIGKVNTRLDNIEKRQDDPPILPQCAELFADIRSCLSNLEGKVETMLLTMREVQKNNEKQHIKK